MQQSKSGRTIKAPLRFADMTFLPGSGVEGCDQYDRGYNRGHMYNTYKDGVERSCDLRYSTAVKNHTMVESTTQKLPKVLSDEITRFLIRETGEFKDDLNFIASDDVEPLKEIVDSDEGEWETGDETSEDEWSEEDDK